MGGWGAKGGACGFDETEPKWPDGFKKAGIDSALESYSSSPPLEDCILLLLPESIALTWKEGGGDNNNNKEKGKRRGG